MKPETVEPTRPGGGKLPWKSHFSDPLGMPFPKNRETIQLSCRFRRLEQPECQRLEGQLGKFEPSVEALRLPASLLEDFAAPVGKHGCNLSLKCHGGGGVKHDSLIKTVNCADKRGTELHPPSPFFHHFRRSRA